MSIKNPEKPSSKTGATAIQEQCSLVAVYFAIAEGASLNMPGKSVTSNKAQVKLDQTLKMVHKKPIPTDWYDTFIETARVVCGYINHTIGTKNGSYKFGWYDGTPNGVPTGKVSSLIPDVWDTFGRNVWNLFGGQGQKDSWNTADIFLVKNGSGDKLLADSKAMKNMFEEYKTDPAVIVGTINTLMSSYFKAGKVIPISLKAKTKSVAMKSKATNVHEWNESGSINVIKSDFVQGARGTGPSMFFEACVRKNNLDFGNVAMNAGNSLQYFAAFQVGDYKTKYMVEVRQSSGSNIKAEAKEIVYTDKGKERRSNAQVGSVPIPIFVDMIEQFVRLDESIPKTTSSLNTPFYISYWSRVLQNVLRTQAIPVDLGALSITGENINEQYGSSKSGEFIKKLFEIDEMCQTNPNKVKALFGATTVRDYPVKLRMKLKQLKVIRAFQIAKSRKKMDKLIVEVFYRAAKQNVEDGDLAGPFVKIS